MRDFLKQLKKGELAGQTMRFIVASVFSATLSLSLPIVFHEVIGIIVELSVALSLIIAFFANFFIHRIYVFKSDTPIFPAITRFLVSSIGFRVSEYLLFLVMFKIMGVNYVISLVIILSISFILKFIVTRSFVFKKNGVNQSV